MNTERLTVRINTVSAMLGVSRRTLERWISAKRFPGPDVRVGKIGLWETKTIHRWIERGWRR